MKIKKRDKIELLIQSTKYTTLYIMKVYHKSRLTFVLTTTELFISVYFARFEKKSFKILWHLALVKYAYQHEILVVTSNQINKIKNVTTCFHLVLFSNVLFIKV